MALEQLETAHSDERLQRCIDDCLEAAQVCEWCADECKHHDHCQACVEVLPKCAESCREMAGA